MKKKAYSIIVALSLLFAASAQPAQAQFSRKLKAKVPFDFAVKGKAFSAGEYTLELINTAGSEVLKIQSRDGRSIQITPARLEMAKKNETEPGLVFYRLGNQYFLAQVQGLKDEAVCELPRSRIKESLAKGAAAPEQSILFVAAHRD